MKSEISRLESMAKANDIDGFISTYAYMRKKGFDVGNEAATMLSQMGGNAIEKVAAILNDTSYSEDLRGTIANCLVRAIDINADIARSPSVLSELKLALNIGDSFISMNAAEALVGLGVENIDGIPTRQYARLKRDRHLSDDLNTLFKI